MSSDAIAIQNAQVGGRLNAFSFWLTALGGFLTVLQSSGWKRTVRRRQRAGHWVVGVRSLALARVIAKHQIGLLDDRVGCGIWHDRYGRQFHRYHTLHAMPRDAPQPYASAGVAEPDDVRNGSDRDCAAIGGADHVARRPVSWEPVGASHVHHRDELLHQQLFHDLIDGVGVLTGIKLSSTGSALCGVAGSNSGRPCCSASDFCFSF
jgi:hypothetical protein